MLSGQSPLLPDPETGLNDAGGPYHSLGDQSDRETKDTCVDLSEQQDQPEDKSPFYIPKLEDVTTLEQNVENIQIAEDILNDTLQVNPCSKLFVGLFKLMVICVVDVPSFVSCLKSNEEDLPAPLCIGAAWTILCLAIFKFVSNRCYAERRALHAQGSFKDGEMFKHLNADELCRVQGALNQTGASELKQIATDMKETSNGNDVLTALKTLDIYKNKLINSDIPKMRHKIALSNLVSRSLFNNCIQIEPGLTSIILEYAADPDRYESKTKNNLKLLKR